MNGMDAEGWVVRLAIGAVAGWLAGKIMKGRGFGLLGNMFIGVIGSIVGGTLFRLLGISLGGGLIGPIVTAVIGAVVLLFLIGLFKRSV